jgi:transcriptional regulator with PAS, ATPase and Fis domain
VQAKLLRALDAREVVRLGALKPRAIDIRVIAATHRDLATMVDEKTFREDLYFRLDGMTIHVPPLRDRKDEIVPLARKFAGTKPLGADAEATLLGYEWPGNVRELLKVIERAVVLAGTSPIGAAHLRFKRPAAKDDVKATADFRGERDRAERRAIEQALDKCGGNQTRAAALLGISRRTLVDRIGKYGIKRGSRE